MATVTSYSIERVRDSGFPVVTKEESSLVVCDEPTMTHFILSTYHSLMLLY